MPMIDVSRSKTRSAASEIINELRVGVPGT